MPRSTLYREQRPAASQETAETQPRPRPARALSESEEAALLELLNGERFDVSDRTIMYQVASARLYQPQSASVYQA